MKKKRIIFNCEYCGKEKEQKIYDYNKAKHHYCSQECKSAAQSKKVKVICANCGKEVIQTNKQYNRAKNHYCSNKCQQEYQHNLCCENRECPICHSVFNVSKKSTQLLCSTKCQHKWQTFQTGELNPKFASIKSKCEYCGEEFYLKRYKINNKSHNFCCKKCRQDWYSKVYSQTEECRKASRERILKCYEQGIFSHTNTKPQILINNLLGELKIPFVNEYNCRHYSIDNYLKDNNLMIEVMGDYWHGNPKKYNKDSLTSVQRKNAVRDKEKHTYISKCYNIEILYLWENDIYNRLDLCKKLILLYIKNNGKLSNYHSYNYYLENNIPKLFN